MTPVSGPRDRQNQLPRAGDEAAAERGLKRWAKLDIALDPGPAAAMAGVEPEALLAGIFAHSPFLSDALLAEPEVLRDLLANGPDTVFANLLAELEAPIDQPRTVLMATLRRYRRKVALLTALADIAGAWSLAEVTRALSRFAGQAVECALDLVLREAAKRGDLQLEEGDHPSRGAGLVVLGMGKLGAFELNYSSDIDLIVLFDPERLCVQAKDGPMAQAVRLTRALVYLLEHKTKDGYVFRTDLRLRPHPPGQPLALSVEDALLYYERFGQNWERAAMIKARVIAGDQEAGRGFLQQLGPFLWRKHLDYAAIRDIHAIKRQINAHRGHGSIRVEGHDLKVGRGGIREIEFFVQTQQLILGGRLPELRLRGTIETLEALVDARWLDRGAADELTAAYEFLRRVEHRLQMVADKQTHSLPENARDFARFAGFMGEGDAESFAAEVKRQLQTVERHFAALFESSLDLGADGALVFTGSEDDPETLRTLDRMGFAQPSVVAGRVRAWHHGHIRATRASRSRELLTELMPEILRAFAEQIDPDAAFERFDQFIRALPAGVQLFSLFRANPRLLSLVANVMGMAPRLADHLSHNVGLFDAMLAPGFFEALPPPAELRAEFEATIARSGDLQDTLDAARRWAQGREFQAGLRILLGECDGDHASGSLTAIAETVIQGMLPRVEAWLADQHGRIDGGSFAVLGLGKLGSRELAIGSDLDLIFVYDAPAEARSDGARPLPAATYFARLGQRLVSALTAQTAEGRLYEIDTRLRPSGNLGPVACSFESFAGYQMNTAQTWEHQALTRGRAVAGDPALAEKVEAAIREALTKPRDPETLAREVRQMRERIFKEHGSDDPWQLKHARGGLVEAEFLAQYLQLRHAAEHPEILTTSTIESFERVAGRGIRAIEDNQTLARAVRLYRRLQAVLRLSVGERFDPKTAPEALRRALIQAAARDPALDTPGPDLAGLEEILRSMQKAVAALFDRHCPPLDP